MKQINKTSFKNEVSDFKGVVVADFFAKWCNPCKMLSPILEEMDKENKDSAVKYVKVDVDEEQELAELYGVMSIPTVIFFKNGQLINQRIGVSSKNDYLNMIKQAKSQSQSKKKDGEKEVIVFTTPTCPYCHMVKDYLTQKNVTFKEIDVSRDQAWAMKMVQRSGQMGVPQIWINNQTVIGFNRLQIDSLLKS